MSNVIDEAVDNRLVGEQIGFCIVDVPIFPSASTGQWRSWE